MHFWPFSSKVKPGNVKYILIFVLKACSSEKNRVEERNYEWSPHILARPANSTLSRITIKSRKKCVSGRLGVKQNQKTVILKLTFAQEPSTREKYYQNFIFFHVLPHFRLVGIEVRHTHIWGFTCILVPEPHFPRSGVFKIQTNA